MRPWGRALIRRDWSPYKKRGPCTQTHRENITGGRHRHRRRTATRRRHAASSHGASEVGRRWQGPGRSGPLRTSEAARSCRHLEFGLLASRTAVINVCCFKPPNVWDFVVAVLGNQYRNPSTLLRGRKGRLPFTENLRCCSRLWARRFTDFISF